jgi:WhiB family redox-sensing transcriptional regulator
MREPRFFENPACAEVGGDFWFPERTDGSMNTVEMVMAKSICRTCPHKAECAEWGIHNERFGIWGGLTQKDRRPIRKQLNIVLKGEDVA